jgi:hypothetical protein
LIETLSEQGLLQQRWFPQTAGKITLGSTGEIKTRAKKPLAISHQPSAISHQPSDYAQSLVGKPAPEGR